jgi:hypothetical protein
MKLPKISDLMAEGRDRESARAIREALAGRGPEITYTEPRFGVWCVRSAASRLGHASAWLKSNGRRVEGTREEMAAKVAEIRAGLTTSNCSYVVMPIDSDE